MDLKSKCLTHEICTQTPAVATWENHLFFTAFTSLPCSECSSSTMGMGRLGRGNEAVPVKLWAWAGTERWSKRSMTSATDIRCSEEQEPRFVAAEGTEIPYPGWSLHRTCWMQSPRGRARNSILEELPQGSSCAHQLIQPNPSFADRKLRPRKVEGLIPGLTMK